MVQSLVKLCAREVVSDHSSSPRWLSCVPRELFPELLDAAFTHCRTLAVGELVKRWPERSLNIGARKKRGHCPPNRLCIQALLLAVGRGLTDRSGLQCEDVKAEDSIMGGWSLTVSLCNVVQQARSAASRNRRRNGDRERKRGLDSVRERGAIKRDRGTVGGGNTHGELSGIVEGGKRDSTINQHTSAEDETVKGVRRRMEIQRRKTLAEQKSNKNGNMSTSCDQGWDEVVVHIRADLFVNSRSWERVRDALSQPGPVRLHCRYLRVEELSTSSIASLLGLLPEQDLLGIDIRYSSLGVSGLAMLLPLLAAFPQLHSLSSLSEPLEVLVLPYLCLTSADLSYLSCSQHASVLKELDLSENFLEETSLPSLCRLFSQAKQSLCQLSLCGCGISDKLLEVLLPSLSSFQALRGLRLALNPLSRMGVLSLARAAAGIPSLHLLLYPNPMEEYEPGLPPMPSSGQLLDWPLVKEPEERDLTQKMLEEHLSLRGRSHDLVVTSDLLNYSPDLGEED
ncbi:hypothetical protein DNTS_027893 [Danionella cerebrum]|uniref:Leucine-rich repeat-containing protein 14 n=1 Tax=Danionella cerebrum TaxID=2873325 RepID=A0A553RNW5_9TELE|nr:hypothetical protein DNTS_027893 [Danionella translucida]